MPLEELSAIKGAVSSESVDALFDVIVNSTVSSGEGNPSHFYNCVSINSLRNDIAINPELDERNSIINNFPNEKNGYLVVAKVIEA